MSQRRHPVAMKNASLSSKRSILSPSLTHFPRPINICFSYLIRVPTRGKLTLWDQRGRLVDVLQDLEKNLGFGEED